MLINRNKIPKVTTFKHDHVMDSYVSKKEIDDMIKSASDKSKAYSDFIFNNMGFDHTRVPLEIITRKSDNVFHRKPILDSGKIEAYTDNSLSDDSIVHSNRFNNLMGIVSSEDLNPDGLTRYSGIFNGIYSKITYGDKKDPEENYSKFSPYSSFNMTDVVKSFIKNDVVYSIHRGGYLTVYNSTTKDVDIVEVIEGLSITDRIPVKNDTYFSDFEFSNVVTQATFNGEDTIAICTTNELILFNINDNTFNIVEGFIVDSVVIDMKLYGSSLYIIENFEDSTYRVKRFNLNENSINNFSSSNEESDFFPNTICKIGNSVIVYESSFKFGKHLMNNISYMVLDDSTCNIKKYELPINVKINHIYGNDINKLYISVSSNIEFIDNSIIVINNESTLEYNHKNKGSSLEDSKISLYKDDIIYSVNDTDISITKISNGNVSTSLTTNICKDRNSGKFITDLYLGSDSLIITFDDNTHGIYPITSIISLLRDSVSVIKNRFSIEFMVDSNLIVLDYNKLYIINNGDIANTRVIDYTPIYGDILEFNSIFSIGYYKSAENSVNLVLVSKTAGCTVRFTMINIDYSESYSVTVLQTSGWNEEICINSELIRNKNNKIYIPISKKGTSTFLVVCDFDKNIIIRNKLIESDGYTKDFYIDENCENTSIGIHNTIYTNTLLDILHVTDQTANFTNEIDTISFSDTSVENIDSSTILANYMIVNWLNPINIHTIDNVRRGETGSKIMRFGEHTITISKEFVKVYNSNSLKLIVNNTFRDDTIVSYYSLSEHEFIINLESSSIILNLNPSIIDADKIADDLKRYIIFNNKNIKHIENGPLHLFNDNNVLSVIDTEDDKKYIDILNMVSDTEISLPNSLYEIKINTIDKFNDHIYITISVVNRLYNGLYGSLLISIDETSVKLKSLDFDNLVEDNGASRINTKFTNTKIIDESLYIVYYRNGKIDCSIIDTTGTITDIPSIYQMDSTNLFLGMICGNDSIDILNSSQYISSADYSTKSYGSYSYPTNNTYYKVFVEGNRFATISVDDKITFKIRTIGKPLHVPFVYYINSSEEEFLTNNFKDLEFVYNIVDNNVGVYKNDTKESIIVDNSNILSSINGYRLFNKRLSDYKSETLFDYFTNGYVVFDNKSGLYSNSTMFEGFGNYIVESDLFIIEYNINDNSLIRDNQYDRFVDISIQNSDDIRVYNSTIINDEFGVKTLSYFINDHKVLLSDSKYIGILNDSISLTFEPSNPEYRPIYEKLKDGIFIILSKDQDNKFGYDSMVINKNGSQKIIDQYNAELKPVYITDSDIIHSIVRLDNGNVIHIDDSETSSDILIDGFTDIVDVISIDYIDGLLMMVNESGEVIFYDINDNDNGTKYNLITNVEEYIVGIPEDYSYSKLLKFSNNNKCTLLLKKNGTDNYYIATNCSINYGVYDSLNTLDDIRFEISVGDIIESLDVKENTFNSLNSPNSSSMSKFILRDSIKKDTNGSFNMNVKIGEISIVGNLNTLTNIYETNISVDDDSITPRIFLSEDIFILQYGTIIDIFEINEGVPDFNPFYRIVQSSSIEKYTITDIMRSFDRLLLKFSNNTCMTSYIRNSGSLIVDLGFRNFIQYDSQRIDYVDYFQTSYGVVGYVAGDGVFVFDESYFKKINKNMVEIHCIDNINNKIYIVDEFSNFGYVSVDNMEYVPIKIFVNQKVISLSYNCRFNTVDIITDNGVVLTYLNGELYKIKEFEIEDDICNNSEILYHPYRDFNITE
ncbi:MAG: hypothetical protein ACOCZ5_01450 [bacterium]